MQEEGKEEGTHGRLAKHRHSRRGPTPHEELVRHTYLAFDRPSRVMSLEIIKLPYKKTDHQISNYYSLQAKRNHFVASVSLTAVPVVL